MRSTRRGFTLYQLLVLLALLALLAAFFLPAIAKVRQAAARTSSSNNLKQLALSFHNFESAYGFMPAGADANGYSFHAQVLPYLEQENIFRLLDFKKAANDPANAQVRKTMIKTFISPSDPLVNPGTDGPTNYMVNAGTKSSIKDNDGVLFAESKLTIVGITDGTSNTLMLVETLRGDGQEKAVDVKRQHVGYKENALKDLKDDAGVNDFKESKNIVGNRGSTWLEGRFLQTIANAGRKINDEKPDVSCGGLGGWSSARGLQGGTNVAMCDGSVRFVKSSIDETVWKALHTRAGGEVIPID